MRFLSILFFVLFSISVPLVDSQSFAKERQGEVAVHFNLNAQTPTDVKNLRLWIPYPISDENQNITDVRLSGNFSQGGIYREGEHGNLALYAEWNRPEKEKILVYTFKVNRKEVIKKSFPEKEFSFSKEEFKYYLTSTSLGPTTGKVKELAQKITKGKKTNYAKAKALYDWIITNMHYDRDIKGCGVGDVEKLVVSLAGKCVDIHSVFVTLARSAGVPAREIFGIRMPKDKEGDMTKAHHCWAEFYVPGYGWVPVDPSDVRKAMLEKTMADVKEAKHFVEYFFGAVDENRIAFQTGRDLMLNPPQNDWKLNYFMYPYAEADGKALNEDLFGLNIGYTISFKEL